MVANEGEGTKVVFTEEDQALLDILNRRKQKVVDDTSFMSKGSIATYAYSATSTRNTHNLASTRMYN